MVIGSARKVTTFFWQRGRYTELFVCLTRRLKLQDQAIELQRSSIGLFGNGLSPWHSWTMNRATRNLQTPQCFAFSGAQRVPSGHLGRGKQETPSCRVDVGVRPFFGLDKMVAF